MVRLSDWPLVGLTPEGSASPTRRPPAGIVVKSFQDLAGRGFSSTSAASRSLTLGVACALHGEPCRSLLTAFRASNPGVDLVVEDVDEVSLHMGLSDRTIDLVIAPAGAGRGTWAVRPLWREPLVAAVADGHPLAAMDAIPPETLRHEAILLAGDKAGDRGLQDAISRALGVRPTGLMHSPVQRDTLFDLVALGYGVTISPRSALRASYPGVCLRPIAGDHALIAYELVWDPDNRSASLEHFLTIVDDLGEANVHAIEF